MTTAVSATEIIDLSRAQAWERLRDLSLAHNYVPGIVSTEMIGTRREGVGASRYVYRNEASYLQETVTRWDEGEGFEIRLHRGDSSPPLFRQASFRYHLADLGSGQTRFTASMRYELPGGFIGRWLEKRLQKTIQQKIDDIALAMKLYYESGEPTTSAILQAHKAAHDAEHRE